MNRSLWFIRWEAKIRKCVVILSLAMALPFAVVSAGAQKKEKTTSKYQNLELVAFDVKKDVQVPPDFLEKFAKELPNQLAKTKKFKQVLSQGETPADRTSPTLRMTGTLVEFNPGSRAKRYFGGYGAGAAEAVAHIKLTDETTGEVVFERDITGKMSSGAFGGSASGVAGQLAREISKVLKKQSL
jgi:uncharacterized protein DUF4410